MPEAYQNKIAVLFDYDLTLTKENSEDPIFRANNIDPDYFWKTYLPQFRADAEKALLAFEEAYNGIVMPPDMQRTGIDEDLAYLGAMFELVREGRIAPLSRAELREAGQSVLLCDGLWEGLVEMREKIRANNKWGREGIDLEYSIISAAPTDVIVGSMGKYITDLCAGIFGNEIIPAKGDDPVYGKIRSHMGYVSSTLKTRFAFRILKGDPDVHKKVKAERKRIHGSNMVAVYDGKRDIPLGAVIGDKEGRRIGVYAGIDEEHIAENRKNAEELLRDGRVEAIFPADYRSGSALRKHLEDIFRELADRTASRIEGRKIMIQLPLTDSSGRLISD
ncbi:MAG: hypothetical protein HYX24_07045 [Candidatus Aenigmarchaeota archaeon]|nr:hypothetical protein [Candidatus Aenigmarchaeota archaeon]